MLDGWDLFSGATIATVVPIAFVAGLGVGVLLGLLLWLVILPALARARRRDR